MLEAGLVQRIDQASLRFNGSVGYDFGRDWSGEVSGFYQGKRVAGNSVLLPLGIVNVGLNKQLPNGARLGINLTDAFETLVARSRVDVPEQNFFAERSFDFSNRTLRVSYTASFGGGQVRAARQRGSVEEGGRVN